jgi:hypothetical protein
VKLAITCGKCHPGANNRFTIVQFMSQRKKKRPASLLGFLYLRSPHLNYYRRDAAA